MILVTNDDGVAFAGINTLAKALEKVGDVLIVAPFSEQSATSHALTLHKPVRMKKLSANCFAVDGTPADCVNLAVNFILKGKKPDLLFSGINKGANLGDDVNYSGTVSAAIEGGIMGIPSIAVSAIGPRVHDPVDPSKNFNFKLASQIAVKVAKSVLAKSLPRGVVLNVNVPPVKKIKGFKSTILGGKNYSNIASEKIDPRGEKYYWICGTESKCDDIPGSDCNAIEEGFVSVTPLRVDPTDHEFLKEMKSWRFN